MTSWVDPEEGLREWLALGNAPDADTLHQVLVMYSPIRHSADTLEPIGLLRRVVETEPEETFTTAFLLLTDRRWRRGSSQLARRVEESGCLDDDELDELAQLFVAADRALFWAVPDHWFGDEELVIGEADADGRGQEADEAPIRVAREVHPPLRRWAAARLVRSDLVSFDAVIERTGAVCARAAAAIMLGVLDAVDALDAAARDRLIDDAVLWPEHRVRRAAIELVSTRDGDEAAYGLAIRDPNARIRDWAPSLLAETLEAAEAESSQLPGAPADRDDEQQSLF